MRAARIEGDVAPDCADRLAGRIGCKVQSERGGSDGDCGIDHAHLNHGDAFIGINANDPI
jgi:hypothetical protein